MADKLREVPGILRVSFTYGLPLSGMGVGGQKLVQVPGVTSEPVSVGWSAAGADDFAVMGTRLLRGRDFDRRDSKEAVVVNETMSRRFWGNPDTAVGKIVQVEGANSRVVGVAEDGKYGSLQEESQPFLFVATPFGKRGEGMLLIETAPEPSAMAGAVRKAIHDTDPDAWILNLISLRQNMRLPLLPYRIASGLVGTIGALAIFLAAVGLYGLVSYSVSRRTHEIGVRVVMGARPSDVLALVFREAMSRLAIGSAIGMTLALAVAQVVRSALYGVRPTDPLGIAAAVAVVAAVGSLAAYAPARRALRVDPATALRQE